MALPATPPKYPSFAAMYEPIVAGAEPWAIYALQRALGIKPATGQFGRFTAHVLREFQRKYGLVVDGIAGPATQQKILELAGAKADQAHGLPIGLGKGFAKAEGGRTCWLPRTGLCPVGWIAGRRSGGLWGPRFRWTG